MKYFKTKKGNLPLPLFFPDATRAVIRTLDSQDIVKTRTPGILVNTYHLYKKPGSKLIKEAHGVQNFMNFHGAIISDSGGFQIMSLPSTVNDKGVVYKRENEAKELLTPEKSIEFQIALKTDLIVALDHFTPPGASYEMAKETVERTILWAKKSRKEFYRLVKLYNIPKKDVPYLIAVVQGGKYQDLRKYCAEELVKIGFDGLGYGGWPINDGGKFDYETAETIARCTPKDYLLYGLGIGKPHEIVRLSKMDYDIFDCVLPTRDARHKRLYIFNSKSKEEIDVTKEDFYSYYIPDKDKYLKDLSPISSACDCMLCKNYSRAYLAHLFRAGELTALRLSTIHNLRFYSQLMEKLQKER